MASLQSKIAEFDEGLENAKNGAFSHSLIECDNVFATDLAISTITFLFLTTFEIINLANLRLLWSADIEPTRMRNCIIRKFAIGPKRKCAIKIFSNGRFHITGCTSAQEAYNYIKNVIDLISPQSEIEAIDFQVQLINSNFSFHVAIDLYALARFMGETSMPFHYNKDKHHALRFKSPDNVSILVFMSGSVIITGAKQPSTTLNAYKCIVDIIEKKFFNGIVLQEYVRRVKKQRIE